MEMSFKQERIVPIYQMLFEMARGNFNSNIPLSAINDELETLAVLINMVAEEMRESIFKDGYINSHHSNKEVHHIAFILDHNLLVKSFTSKLNSCLGFAESEILGKHLSCILSEASIENLESAVKGLSEATATVVLDFISKEQQLVSVRCSMVRLINDAELLLHLDYVVRQHAFSGKAASNENSDSIKATKADAVLTQKLYDYIMAHLEEPLPSIKELSRQFGTNEYKLKSGFRYFFKTSIYQFYNEERLKRAYFMIEHTQIPLKNISVMNGFNNYPNFSKAFKKRFGVPPYEVPRVS